MRTKLPGPPASRAEDTRRLDFWVPVLLADKAGLLFFILTAEDVIWWGWVVILATYLAVLIPFPWLALGRLLAGDYPPRNWWD